MIGIDVFVSIATGVLLWALLPRGVVLTRAVRTETLKGERLYDTWELKNDSPLPVRLTSVRLVMPGYEGDLPWSGQHGVILTLDDETAEIARADWQRPWNKEGVARLNHNQAVVDVNTSLFIEYRRAGWYGVLERRRLAIHGAV